MEQDNKKIKNSTKQIFDGIEFKSKLELFTYKSLIINNIKDFIYEGLTFTLLEKFESENSSYKVHKIKQGSKKIPHYIEESKKIRAITYTPDFTCINEETKTGWIIETKGFSNDAFPLKWKLFKKWLKDNNYNVSLYLPNNQKNVLHTIEMIKEKYYV